MFRTSAENKSCRHHNPFMVGTYYLWCPDCGGLRKLQPEQRGVTWVFKPQWSAWLLPKGPEAAERRLDRLQPPNG